MGEGKTDVKNKEEDVALLPLRSKMLATLRRTTFYFAKFFFHPLLTKQRKKGISSFWEKYFRSTKYSLSLDLSSSLLRFPFS